LINDVYFFRAIFGAQKFGIEFGYRLLLVA